MKIALNDTYIGKSTNIKDYARNARKFLLDNVSRITFSDDEERRLLNTQDSMMRTAMGDLYQQAAGDEKLGMLKLLILDKIDKIPSYFLISWLDIDTLALRDTDRSSAEILNSISGFNDKILVDVTPYYSSKRRQITDISSFHSRIIRSLLCRSYHTSDKMWLSPSLVYLLTKFYATILSTKIGRTYNLTYQEQQIAAAALAIYFVNQCTNDREVINPMMGKMDFLRRSIDTKGIYDFVAEKYTVHTYGIDAIVDVIVSLGPSRLSSFNKSTFYSMYSNLTSNNVISMVALEYPPYWCHLILSSLSGDKSSMYHSIKTLNLRADAVTFQNEILKTTSFIHSL